MELTQADIDRVVATALAEDVGAGDRTSEALVPADARCRAQLLLEEPGVVCGVPAVAAMLTGGPELFVRLKPAENGPVTLAVTE